MNQAPSSLDPVVGESRGGGSSSASSLFSSGSLLQPWGPPTASPTGAAPSPNSPVSPATSPNFSQPVSRAPGGPVSPVGARAGVPRHPGPPQQQHQYPQQHHQHHQAQSPHQGHYSVPPSNGAAGNMPLPPPPQLDANAVAAAAAAAAAAASLGPELATLTREELASRIQGLLLTGEAQGLPHQPHHQPHNLHGPPGAMDALLANPAGGPSATAGLAGLVGPSAGSGRSSGITGRGEAPPGSGPAIITRNPASPHTSHKSTATAGVGGSGGGTTDRAFIPAPDHVRRGTTGTPKGGRKTLRSVSADSLPLNNSAPRSREPSQSSLGLPVSPPSNRSNPTSPTASRKAFAAYMGGPAQPMAPVTLGGGAAHPRSTSRNASTASLSSASGISHAYTGAPGQLSSDPRWAPPPREITEPPQELFDFAATDPPHQGVLFIGNCQSPEVMLSVVQQVAPIRLYHFGENQPFGYVVLDSNDLVNNTISHIKALPAPIYGGSHGGKLFLSNPSKLVLGKDPRVLDVHDERSSILVLKNLPFSLKQDKLMEILASSEDSVRPYAINYHFDPNGLFRGMAFAKYRSIEDAEKVFVYLNDKEIQGRRVRVEYKRKNKPPSPADYEPPDEDSQKLYNQLLHFRDHSPHATLMFPASLTGFQRKQLHIMAEKLGLGHVSEGDGDLRFVLVSKNKDLGRTPKGSRKSAAPGPNNGGPPGNAGPPGPIAPPSPIGTRHEFNDARGAAVRSYSTGSVGGFPPVGMARSSGAPGSGSGGNNTSPPKNTGSSSSGNVGDTYTHSFSVSPVENASAFTAPALMPQQLPELFDSQPYQARSMAAAPALPRSIGSGGLLSTPSGLVNPLLKGGLLPTPISALDMFSPTGPNVLVGLGGSGIPPRGGLDAQMALKSAVLSRQQQQTTEGCGGSSSSVSSNPPSLCESPELTSQATVLPSSHAQDVVLPPAAASFENMQSPSASTQEQAPEAPRSALNGDPLVIQSSSAEVSEQGVNDSAVLVESHAVSLPAGHALATVESATDSTAAKTSGDYVPTRQPQGPSGPGFSWMRTSSQSSPSSSDE